MQKEETPAAGRLASRLHAASDGKHIAGRRREASLLRHAKSPPACATVQGTAAARLRTLHANLWPAANGTPLAEKGCSTVMPAYVSPPAVASWISPPGRAWMRQMEKPPWRA
ncbi:MAG: hypothetical protein ACLVKK_06095 [Ruthenibacterium sp.]